MKISRQIIKKSLIKTFISNKFSTSFTGYSQRVYQKINVTRLPQENFTLFIDINDKIQNFLKHLNKMFPQSNFIVSNQFQNKLGKNVEQEDLKNHEEISKLQLVQLLLHSNLVIYQHTNNKFNICMGVQMKQYNLTNNRSLPQNIAKNIIELSEQWITNKPIQNALIKTQNYNETEHNQYLAQKAELNKQIQLAYANYIQLYKFYKKQFIDSGKARSLMANLIALMTLNWGMLFAITYGKYGWDVGQPVSYLTNLGVQLIAMMGIFQMDQIVQKTGKQDFQAMSKMMNIESQIKMRQFQIAYCKRNY